MFSSDEKDPWQQDLIGQLYEIEGRVEGGKNNQYYKEAVIWYKHSVAQNNPSAQKNLGMMYITGIGVKQDQKKGFDLICKSANQMHASGCLMLGMIYVRGTYVDRDYGKAKKYLELANISGNYATNPSYHDMLKIANSALEKD
jgi:TPR repeat protein